MVLDRCRAVDKGLLEWPSCAVINPKKVKYVDC